MKENTVFSVQPMFGIVPRREMVELIVTAQVDDNARFTDKLTISVKRGVSHTIPLLAEGKGTTIVSHPSFDSCVDLGTHFACSQCRKQFTLTNRGRRMQALSWTTEGFSMVKLKKAELDMNMVDKSDVNAKSAVKGSGDVKRPMYQLIPDKFELLPLQSQTFVITAYSAVPQEVKERLVCHSIIGRNPHKERIMSFDVKCRFISPLLDFSTKEVTFDMEQEPGSELIKHYKTLQLKNITPLPLTALLTCNYPFSLSVSDVNSYNVTQVHI
jgi:hydrocephalus-inducing protein